MGGRDGRGANSFRKYEVMERFNASLGQARRMRLIKQDSQFAGSSVGDASCPREIVPPHHRLVMWKYSRSTPSALRHGGGALHGPGSDGEGWHSAHYTPPIVPSPHLGPVWDKEPRSLRHMTPTAPSEALFVVPSRIPFSSGTERFGPCLPPRDLLGSLRRWNVVFNPCSWLAGRMVRFIPRGGVASFPPFRRTVCPEDVPSRWSGRLRSRVCRVPCLRMGVRCRGWLPRGSFREVLDPIFCSCVAMRRSALMHGSHIVRVGRDRGTFGSRCVRCSSTSLSGMLV